MQFSRTLLLALAAGASAVHVSDSVGEWLARERFAAFEIQFSKAYAADEREGKFVTFVENLELTVAKNAALRAAGKDEVHGVTKFSDMSAAEFRETMLNKRMATENMTAGVARPSKVAAASTFDWRDEGIVTAVKNQAYCGSCWAFSATETLESQYAKAGNTLTELSPQQIVSCDTTDSGCSGGWYYTAWMDYVATNGGLTTEATYPYNAATKAGHATSCDTSLEKETVSGTTPTGYTWATTPCSSFTCGNQDEDTLKANLVSYGPISIACDASEWSSYTGGVMTSSSCSSGSYSLDHAIQLVGYNADASTPYWIVRNSWDTTWGEDGYIYLAMGENTCGLADKAAMVQL